jgi:hypothetical protein
VFKIEILCDDKNLARVLRALTGLALGSPSVQPVVNAEQQKNGRVVAASAGDLVALLSAHLKRNRLTEVRAAQIKEFAVANGYAESSHQHILKTAVAHKLLRKKGKGSGMTYTVAQEK